MTTPADKFITLASYKAAQYAAIVAKGASVFAADWGAYAAAIRTIPSGTIAVPKIVTDMPFTVDAEPTGTAWYVRPDGAGDKDGTSWSNAFATRQEAVNAASAGDHIRVWEGVYYLDAVQTPKAGVSEYYGFNDDGTWAKRQPFLHPSKLDAGFTGNNFNNAAYVFLDGQVIDGMWIQNVTTGGGMVLTQKTHLKNCTINNNTGVNGGGVHANSGSTLTNCTIINNTGTYGGGVYAINSSTLTNCNIVNNTGTNGGGVNAGSSNLITNCVIFNNTASQSGGGVFGTASVFLTSCAICNNTSNYGGGSYLTNGGRCYNVTAINNTAATGANLWVGGNSQIIYNCVSWGGDIYLGQANYAYKIYNCASNFALTGVAGWSNLADVQNFLPLTEFPFAAPGVAPYDGSGAFFGSATIGRTEEALAFIDRVILGRMPNVHPPAGSPLIGAGYYGAGVTPDTDADGKARPNPPSIGAYEP